MVFRIDGHYVRETLYGCNGNGQPTGDLRKLLAPAFAVLLQFLKGRNGKCHQLNHDGGRDVRHHTQSQNGCVSECAAGKRVQKPEQAVGIGRLTQAYELHFVDAGQRDKGTETIHGQKPQGEQDSTPEFLYLPDIAQCFNEILHLPAI